MTLDKIKGRKITGGSVRFNGKTYKAKKKRTGRWSVELDRQVKAKTKATKKIRRPAARP